MAKKQIDMFFDIFAGEFVSITTKLQQKITQQTEENILQSESFLSMQGFLVEKDDLYYYIGDKPNSVLAAIKINEVVHIEITQEENVFTNILDQLDVPTDKKGVN